MSQVARNGKNQRPSWNFNTNQFESGHATVEMLESVRNCLEQVLREIQGIRACSTVHQGFRDLSTIVKNTTKRSYKRKK